MAINKKLIHFLNLADFETRLANNEILNTSIVFIKDAKKIWTHGNYYDGNTVDLTNIENSIDGKVDKVSGKSLSTNDYTTEEKNKLAGAYTKPNGGIPKTDLESSVLTSLSKADTALLAHQDISVKQDVLISGVNIKTVNGKSILGEGDITIKGGELEKYDNEKSWSIVVTSLNELLTEHSNAPEGTKAIVVIDGNNMLGVNLFDFIMGTIEGSDFIFSNLDEYTLKISAIDTNVEFPVSNASDVVVYMPFNHEIKIEMGSDLASVYKVSVRIGYDETVWLGGDWVAPSLLVGNTMPAVELLSLDDNTIAGFTAIAPAIIVDIISEKTITEYIKNGDNWEVWSEGKSVLETEINKKFELFSQTIPTKNSQFENDSNFVSSDGLKTINGESIVGSGDMVVNVTETDPVFTSSPAHGITTDDIAAWNDKMDETPVLNHGTGDTTYSITPNVFHLWGEVASLNITLVTPDDPTILNEYMFQFTSGTTATVLSLPSDIVWISEPTIEASKTYQISIVNNLAVIGGF